MEDNRYQDSNRRPAGRQGSAQGDGVCHPIQHTVRHPIQEHPAALPRQALQVRPAEVLSLHQMVLHIVLPGQEHRQEAAERRRQQHSRVPAGLLRQGHRAQPAVPPSPRQDIVQRLVRVHAE